ncbi:hypothetical protein PM082_018257 [Marasmius tenuissimus]|nr:hypothetical protein PM082_018257 [Marasmius tenuissimus]
METTERRANEGSHPGPSENLNFSDKERINATLNDPPPYKPSLGKSWEMLMGQVKKYDDDLVQGWKEDLDTLLVFAGLFSAVVTAFAVESYQQLSEDPAETTVALLRQISQQLNQPNATASISPEQFEPSPSNVRINCFWFLSLILSLTSSLFALLCKQWLREHLRDTNTRTPGEALALRQLRHDSFNNWKVPKFLAILPVLLEVALLLFFAGLLELLWTLNALPLFAVGAASIGLSAVMYFLTTILPGMNILGIIASEITNRRDLFGFYQSVCPYKSPQAWGIFRLMGRFVTIRYRWFQPTQLSKTFSANYTAAMDIMDDWAAVDFDITKRSEERTNGLRFMYQFRGLRWFMSMFRDMPSMWPFIQTVLESFDAKEMFPVVFVHWAGLYTWTEPTQEDIPELVQGGLLTEKHNELGLAVSSVHETPYLSEYHWKWLTSVYWYRTYLDSHHPRTDEDLLHFLRLEIPVTLRLARRNNPQQTNIYFILPFYLSEKLWTHRNEEVRKFGLEILNIYREEWISFCASGRMGEKDERFAFIESFARHILSSVEETGASSALMTSESGMEFIRFLNDQIIDCRLFLRAKEFAPLATPRNTILDHWASATQKLNERLPHSFFRAIPPRMTPLANWNSVPLVNSSTSSLNNTSDVYRPLDTDVS